MADKKNINPDEEVNDNNNNNFKNLIADYLKGQRDEVGNEEMGDKPSEFDKLNKKKTTKQDHKAKSNEQKSVSLQTPIAILNAI